MPHPNVLHCIYLQSYWTDVLRGYSHRHIDIPKQFLYTSAGRCLQLHQNGFHFYAYHPSSQVESYAEQLKRSEYRKLTLHRHGSTP